MIFEIKLRPGQQFRIWHFVRGGCYRRVKVFFADGSSALDSGAYTDHGSIHRFEVLDRSIVLKRPYF